MSQVQRVQKLGVLLGPSMTPETDQLLMTSVAQWIKVKQFINGEL